MGQALEICGARSTLREVTDALLIFTSITLRLLVGLSRAGERLRALGLWPTRASGRTAGVSGSHWLLASKTQGLLAEAGTDPRSTCKGSASAEQDHQRNASTLDRACGLERS